MTWRLAYRNLFRNKRRSLATGSAIVAGIVGLLLIGGFILRVERVLRINTVYLMNRGHVLVYQKDGLQKYLSKPSRYQIKLQDYNSLLSVLEKYKDQIEWVGQTVSGAGLITNDLKSRPFLGRGVDMQTLQKTFLHEEVKSWGQDFLTEQDELFVKMAQADPKSISLTKRLSDLIGKKVGDDSSVQLAGKTQYGDLGAVDAVLSAFHTTGSEFSEDTSLIATTSLMQELYQTDGYHYVMIFLKNESDLKSLVESLNSDFKNLNLPLVSYPYTNPEISSKYVGTMGFLYVMAAFFVFLICGAVALSIVNSLTMGILERTREIGTLGAIGFDPNRVAILFTQEGIWLTLFSCVLGLFISVAGASLIDSLRLTFNPPGFSARLQVVITPNLTLTVLVCLGMLLIAAATSYFVSKFKLKSNIAELLAS